jgi:hypothetical protein
MRVVALRCIIGSVVSVILSRVCYKFYCSGKCISSVVVSFVPGRSWSFWCDLETKYGPGRKKRNTNSRNSLLIYSTRKESVEQAALTQGK